MLDQRAQRSAAVAVVETDVEARARLAGNEVDRLVADVDGGEFEIGRTEMRRALVERLGHERAHQCHQSAHRIFGALRIGDMALLAGHDQHAVLRAAAADLDGIADALDVARLAQDAVIESLAALGRPLQQLHRAVDGDAFLIAGDQE